LLGKDFANETFGNGIIPEQYDDNNNDDDDALGKYLFVAPPPSLLKDHGDDLRVFLSFFADNSMSVNSLHKLTSAAQVSLSNACEALATKGFLMAQIARPCIHLLQKPEFVIVVLGQLHLDTKEAVFDEAKFKATRSVLKTYDESKKTKKT
jgi:hypothetical protein